NTKPSALGGWTISAQHSLDVANKTVYRGDGGVQRVDDLNRYVLNPWIGTGVPPTSYATPLPDGAAALSIQTDTSAGFAVAADGSLFFEEAAHKIIGKVTPDGIYHHFAGANGGYGSTGEGVAALQANISPSSLALGPDSSLYFADSP